MGTVPVICISNEGDLVTDIDETTESTTIDVLVQLTDKAGQFYNLVKETEDSPSVTAFTLPLICITEFLQPKTFTAWWSSQLSRTMLLSSFWYS